MEFFWLWVISETTDQRFIKKKKKVLAIHIFKNLNFYGILSNRKNKWYIKCDKNVTSVCCSYQSSEKKMRGSEISPRQQFTGNNYQDKAILSKINNELVYR